MSEHCQSLVSEVEQRTGIELLAVPGGQYPLGPASGGGDSGEGDGNGSVTRVTLQPFWIAKHLVTRRQFRLFTQATGRRMPRTHSRKDRVPIYNVAWHDAVAYCRWAGLELPSEAQWEAAARGTDRRIYPWGNESPSIERASYEQQGQYPEVVDSRSAGTGPYGTLGQAGYQWEWCRNLWLAPIYHDPDGHLPLSQADSQIQSSRLYARVIRDGSWAGSREHLRTTARCGSRATVRATIIGFRPIFRPPLNAPLI